MVSRFYGCFKWVLAVFFLPTLLALPAQAQVSEAWVVYHQGTYPYLDIDYSQDSVVDSAGDVYVVGSVFNDTIDSDLAVVKYSGATGDILWQSNYDGLGHGADVGNAVVLDGNGYLYVTGSSTGTGGNMDVITQRYNAATGARLWTRRFNGTQDSDDHGVELDVRDGYVYVAADVRVASTAGVDIQVFKYSVGAGSLVWSHRYSGPGPNTDVPMDMAVDSSGNVFVAGRSTSASYDMVTLKIDSAGVRYWAKRYDNPSGTSDVPYALVLHTSGDVIVTATSANQMINIRYRSADGTQLWLNRYTHADSSSGIASALDQYGNLYVTGHTYTNGVVYTALFKYRSSTGERVWISQVGGWPGDAICVDTAGDVYTVSGVGIFQIRKVSGSTGALLWSIDHDPPANESGANDISVDNAGGLIVSGTAGGNSYRWITLKFQQGH